MNEALTNQAAFLFMTGDFKQAARISSMPGVIKILNGMRLSVYNELFQLNERSTPQQVEAVRKKAEHQMNRAVSSDIVISMRRALNLLKVLEKK